MVATVPIGKVSSDIINIKDPRFGAIGDGSTDDTVAIRNAITEGLSAGRPVYIPETSAGFKVTASLRFPGATGLKIFGPGRAKAFLKVVASEFDFGADNAILALPSADSISLEGFAIKNPNLSNAAVGSRVFYLQGGGDARLTDVWAYGCRNSRGFEFNGFHGALLFDVRSEFNHTGLFGENSLNLTAIKAGLTNNTSNELNWTGYAGATGFGDYDTLTFICSTLDEGGSTLAPGPYSRWRFIDSKIFSGQSADFAVRLRNTGGGGGRITFDGGYIGVWASNQLSGGGIDSGGSGSGILEFNGTKIRGAGASKATNYQSGSSYHVIYNDAEIIGIRDEANAASVTETSRRQYPTVILPDSNSDAASTIGPAVQHVRVDAITTNADDWLVLPSGIPGRKIRGWSVVAHEMRTPASSNATINNVDADGTKEAAIPATTLWEVECVATDTWILRASDELGAPIAAIVPD